jgi:hypothetical protein
LPLAAGFWLLATGFWPLATGFWLLAAGCWLLAPGSWQLDVFHLALDSGSYILGIEYCRTNTFKSIVETLLQNMF